MNEHEKQKIQNFLNDKVMSQAVYNAIREEFLSDNIKNDVQVLAASRLAVGFLKEAFKRMERFKKEDKPEQESESNVGL